MKNDFGYIQITFGGRIYSGKLLDLSFATPEPGECAIRFSGRVFEPTVSTTADIAIKPPVSISMETFKRAITFED